MCTASVGALEAALTAGADRVELCAALDLDGVTPSAGMIETAVALASGRTKVHVLVRPREGDFVYSALEVDTMCRDVLVAKSAGADGLVFGALTEHGTIDVEICRRLVALARPAKVTFHRAFDATCNPLSAFEDVKALGVERLLTSGAAATAFAGAPLLAELGRRAGNHLSIMPGGGITEHNAGQIVALSRARELHFSGRDPRTARVGADGGPPLAERLARIMASALTGTSEGGPT